MQKANTHKKPYKPIRASKESAKVNKLPRAPTMSSEHPHPDHLIMKIVFSSLVEPQVSHFSPFSKPSRFHLNVNHK